MLLTDYVYAIVKFSENGYWDKYYPEDPKITGVGIVRSAHGSYNGILIGIDQTYPVINKRALQHLDAMRKLDRTAGYDFCYIKKD